MWKEPLLVADDEEIECCGITNVVRECFPQIIVVGSVHNGTEMIRAAREYHPDIIIVDINMPGMNGLEAAEVLRQEKINSRLIINTAYSYFEYAKKAILLKAVDYLLKPIEREMFCQTIDRVLKAIDQERSKDLDDMKDNKTFQKMLDVAGREVLSSVIMGNPNVEELNIWLENMGHTYWGGFFVVGKCMQDQVSEQQLKEICQLSEHKQRSEGTFLAKVFNGMVVWFFFPEEKIGKTNYREGLTEYLEKISEEARRISGSEMHFGVSNWHYDFEEMHQAYQEAVTAVNSSPEQKIVAFQTVGQVRKLMQISNKNMEKLAEYVKEQDITKCKNLLEEQLQLCREAEVTEQEKNVMFTLMLQDCSRKVCGYNIYSWNQIKAAVSKDSENLSTAVLYLIHNLDALKDSTNTRTGYVLKSLGYIEEHFTENISLDMAAENMGISSFYLSRLLTQQLQISFVDLLTSARRLRGFNAAIRAYSDMKIADMLECGSSTLTAQKLVTKVMEEEPEINAIFCAEGMGTGACCYVMEKQNRKVGDSMHIIGYDYNGLTKRCIEEGYLSACIQQDSRQMGELAAQVLDKYLNEGIRPAKTIHTHASLIRRDNMEEAEKIDSENVEVEWNYY